MRPILRSLPRGLHRSNVVSSSAALPLRRLPPNLSCSSNPYLQAWRLQAARSFASKPGDGTTNSNAPIAMPPPPGSAPAKPLSSSSSPASTNSSTESSVPPKSEKQKDAADAGKPTESEEAVETDKKDTVDKQATHSDAIHEAMKNLPSQLEARRSEAGKRFSKAMDDLQTAVFSAGQKLNDLTGYSEIQILKNSIEQQEENVKNSRAAVQKAKEDYQSAISRRSASQREVNELLQRKHAWSPTDLERFTSLYRNDHTNEQAEVRASEALVEAERVADEAQAELSRSILARYHEEQIWSDKIRRASTWGTWGLMGFNVLLFIVVQLGLEPWKRKRLVGGFEEKVREVIQEENQKNALATKGLMERHEEEKRREAAEAQRTLDQEVLETAKDVQEELAAGSIAATVTTELADIVAEREPIFKEPVLETLKRPDQWKGVAEAAARRVEDKGKELWSEKEVRVTQRDMTKVTLEAAATGAVLSAIFTFLISQR